MPIGRNCHRRHRSVLFAGESFVHVHRQPVLNAAVPMLHRLAERPTSFDAAHVNVFDCFEIVFAILRFVNEFLSHRLRRSVTAFWLEFLRVSAKASTGTNAFRQDYSAVNSHPEDEERRPHEEESVEPRAFLEELSGSCVINWPNVRSAEEQCDVNRDEFELFKSNFERILSIDSEREMKVVVKCTVSVVRT